MHQWSELRPKPRCGAQRSPRSVYGLNKLLCGEGKGSVGKAWEGRGEGKKEREEKNTRDGINIFLVTALIGIATRQRGMEKVIRLYSRISA